MSSSPSSTRRMAKVRSPVALRNLTHAGSAFALQADIGTLEGCDKLAKETLAHTGGQLNALVHNAGLGQMDQTLENLVRSGLIALREQACVSCSFALAGA